MAKNFVELWTSFVKIGIPQLKSKTTFQWPAMTSIESFSILIVKLFKKKFHLMDLINSYLKIYAGFLGPYLHINEIFDLGGDFTDEFTIGLKHFDEYLNEYSNEWVTNFTELYFNKG